jgi:hypothetical protein
MRDEAATGSQLAVTGDMMDAVAVLLGHGSIDSLQR